MFKSSDDMNWSVEDEATPPQRKKEGVIILGVLRENDFPLEAPIHDESYEVWCMNASWEPERWDRWFQLHGIEHMMDANGHGIRYIRWLQTVSEHYENKEVFVFESERHHFPHASVFPLVELIEHFCGKYVGQQDRYFTGSFAYLVALAILWEYERIWIDTRGMTGEEWAIPCIEFYIGMAIERGIEVYVGENSGLLNRAAQPYDKDKSGFLYGRGRHLGGNWYGLEK